MTSQEAKPILVLYRPDTRDDADPEVAQALALVQQDPELRQWFEQHCACQRVLRSKFHQIPVPQSLKETILAARKTIRPRPWWQHPAWMAAAAVLLLAALFRFWILPSQSGAFDNFRLRMVKNASRQYGMDVETNRMEAVRQFMAQRGAPADYEVPTPLRSRSLLGGGVLAYRTNTVSMVCFDRGNRQMLFLFIVDRAAVPDAPAESPQLRKVSRFLTAGWSRGNRAYLLVGAEEPAFLQKYIGPNAP